MALLEQALKAHPFFANLGPSHLNFIAACSYEDQFQKNEYILREGEASDKFYLILEGRVVLRSASPGHHYTTIHILGKGDIVGWSWLIPPYQCLFSAEATQPTQVITIDGQCLREKCEEDHHFGYELQKRFGSAISQMLELTKQRLG